MPTRIVFWSVCLLSILASTDSEGNSRVAVEGSYSGPQGFDDGMASTMYCGNSPESWIRGDAQIQDATLVIRIELETDSVVAGPSGIVTVTLWGDDGGKLATIRSAEVGRTGKPPGVSATSRFSSVADVGADVLARTT